MNFYTRTGGVETSVRQRCGDLAILVDGGDSGYSGVAVRERDHVLVVCIQGAVCE